MCRLPTYYKRRAVHKKSDHLHENLAWAIETQNIKEAIAYINEGADINFYNGTSYNIHLDILGIAIDSQNMELIRFVLNNNFDPKAVAGHLEYWLAVYGCCELTKILFHYTEFISIGMIKSLLLKHEMNEMFNDDGDEVEFLKMIYVRRKDIMDSPEKSELLVAIEKLLQEIAL